MEIKRFILEDMLRWKNSEQRRPLIIQGARQIGKTWIMKKFGETYYQHVAYFNFESSEELASEFERTKDPRRIVERLRLYSGSPILPGDTLIIFDEIQQCGKALNSLKYFCEEAPEYHIVAAGSLLGVALHKNEGFPVGKVDFLKMYPVSFREYLATSSPEVADYIDKIVSIEPLPEIITGKIWEQYRLYQVCGGMPKAVLVSLESGGNELIAREQQEILTSFFLDFSKHAPISEFPRISAVWQSLPSQLAKENRKFIYKVVKPGARAREYEGALSWLREAGLIYQIYCCGRPALPLSAGDDLGAFKLYLLDVGLLRAMAKLPPEIFVSENHLFKEFKGALTENAVLQAVIPRLEQQPRYWVSSGTAEVDFIIQHGLEVIPAEVKSSTNTSGKSLSVYIGKYNPAIALIYSSRELSVNRPTADSHTSVMNIPLPLADWTPELLGLV